MANKIARVLIFLFFSYCIYQMFFFVDLIFGLPDAGFLDSRSPLSQKWSLFFFPFVLGGHYISNMLAYPDLLSSIKLLDAFALSLAMAVYGFVPYLWFKVTCIATAWLLALTGMIAGPGLVLIYLHYSQGTFFSCAAAMAIVIIFFPLLEIGNHLQKKYGLITNSAIASAPPLNGCA